MELEFSGAIWHWRGPAPFHFLTVPDDECDRLHEVARAVTYGWGMVPVQARIGATTWQTSLWPKDGRYLLPVKDAVRRAELIDLGDTVTARLTVAAPG
ncbi:DUF1905 domain-containing protein [Modestobacter italicus]|uniref:DUF1905 domain-containing protein n=1 Tax=Modestobacter italicus (strain DSM 44449 / CECT 9708 / BC 501) TaxID=2732864 RepID=UPI001C986288|nr:DUF1905 domain-containing protein [Modestobacter italicus]